MLRFFKNEKHLCKLCFGDLRKLKKAPTDYFFVCNPCWNAERLRLRSNNKHKRNKKYSTGRISVRSWFFVLEKYKWSCSHCGIKGRHKLTLDHIIPINKGGENSADNCQPLCVPCHEKKDGYKRKPFWWLRRIIRIFRKWKKNLWKRFGMFIYHQ